MVASVGNSKDSFTKQFFRNQIFITSLVFERERFKKRSNYEIKLKFLEHRSSPFYFINMRLKTAGRFTLLSIVTIVSKEQ